MRALLVVRALAVLTVTYGCGSATEQNRTLEGSSSESATVSTAVDYGDGVELRSPRDVAKLRNAPEGFRQYMAGRIDELVQADFEKECPPVVRVNVIDPEGFATGSINGCGGYALIWKNVDGVWQQVLGGQDYWRCTDLRKHEVPVSVVHDGKCLEFKGQETTVVPYGPR